MSQDIFNSNKVGVCVKDQSKVVSFQNELCKQVCRNKEGQQCLDYCMANYNVMTDDEKIFNEGIRTVHHLKMENSLVDATIINDSEKITTLFYRIDDHQDQQLKYFKDKGLTKTEMNVISSVLAGATNSEIAKGMFVSKATLKTHLNNIYKKIPETLKSLLSRSRV